VLNSTAENRIRAHYAKVIARSDNIKLRVAVVAHLTSPV
jgi:hypothetical protein